MKLLVTMGIIYLANLFPVFGIIAGLALLSYPMIVSAR